MKPRLGVLLALLLLAPAVLCAQAHYATRVLHEMGAALRQRGARLDSTGTFMLPGSQLSYEVRLSDSGVVAHLGRPFLNREVKLMSPSPLYDFMERYVLRLQLLDADKRRQLLADDKVRLSLRQMCQVDSACDMSLTSDDDHFLVAWSRQGHPVAQMSFPRSLELISGMDKIEHENRFRASVDGHQPDTTLRQMPPVVDDSLLTDTAVYYTQRHGYYIIKAMKSETYYVRSFDGTLLPVNSGRLPVQTLSNLFQQMIAGQYTLHVRQKKYGFREEEFDVSQSRFTSYCRDTGCTPYVGILSADERHVKACIVYVNTLLNYNHMLILDAGCDVLARRQGTMQATLYCYIPTHNLKALFQPSELKEYNQ